MPDPCPHTRLRIIAKDELLQFAECLDCGEILEKEEGADRPPPDESLSDA